MKIIFATPEAYPFVSTGGLADVAASLAAALQRAGHDVSLIMPLYRDALITSDRYWAEDRYITTAGEEFGIARTELPNSDVQVFMVSKDEFFNRPGIYGPDDDSAYPDNALRFSFFSRAVVSLCESFETPPDILHCHDWQTGLVAAYVRNFSRPAVVFTIHNIRYQGNFPREDYHVTCLPPSLLSMNGLEFYGTFSCLKAGIVFSDRITTVSGSYADEIQTPEFGEGMEGILRRSSSRLSGILNGIDHRIWNPADDPAIASSYSADSITPRRICRDDLIRYAGFDRENGRMIVGMVTRLTQQKGLDLLFPIVGKLIEEGIGLVILGTGEKRYMNRLSKLSRKHGRAVSVTLKYDEGIARRIFSGSDLFLMPSRFEPCGLGQMIAMRYGAPPLVRCTGGLVDTVIDESDNGFGFIFRNADPEELLKTVLRARARFNNRRKWTWLAKKCMRQDNSWSNRTELYEKVYLEALNSRRGR